MMALVSATLRSLAPRPPPLRPPFRLPPQPHLVPLPPQEVDRHLGDICSRVHDALPPRLARATCAALSAALQSVLLEGGPLRLFTMQDSDMLEADFAQVGGGWLGGGVEGAGCGE